MQGTVKFFKHDKGYGFIQPSTGGEDTFVHATDLEPQQDRIDAGRLVEFDIALNERNGKMKAVSVRVLPNVPPEVERWMRGEPLQTGNGVRDGR